MSSFSFVDVHYFIFPNLVATAVIRNCRKTSSTNFMSSCICKFLFVRVHVFKKLYVVTVIAKNCAPVERACGKYQASHVKRLSCQYD